MILLLRRFSAFLLSFFFCLTLLVPSALADDGFTSSGGSDFDNDFGVRWSGFVDDGSSTGVFVKAPDMWSAAVYACGGNPGLLSADVRSKLSDPNYGGRFYAYAQSFGHIMSVSEIPGWVPLYILAAEGIANVWHGEFGDMLLWSSKVSNSLITGALVDFRRVLAGEDLGGGGSGGDVNVSDCVVLQCQAYVVNSGSVPPANDYYANARNATIDSSGNVVLGSGYTRYSDYLRHTNYTSSVRFYVPSSIYEYLSANFGGKKYLFALGMRKFQNDAVVNLFVADDFRYVWSSYNQYVSKNFLYFTGDTYSSESILPAYHDSEGVFFVLSDSVVPLSLLSLDHVNASYTSSFYDVVSAPSGDWPEPVSPVMPDPPELPGPAVPTVAPEPTVTTPTPTWPDVNITVNPPAVVAPVTPDGLDYTELLERINDNLNSINAYVIAVNSSLNSLRSDLVTEFDSVVRSLRNIYGYLQHMDSVLEVHCVHIRNKIEESAVFIANYMRSLVHWLAEQLDYDDTYGTDSYDDSLLTTINEKLGGGTYEPNPIKDELGYYEWLDDLWDRFLLGDDWQSSASSISASFGQLRTRFPFSIPWDIVALFGLFVHEPVTPVFDLPLYFSGSSSTPVRVDLTPWDGVASVVRPLIYVIFALKLALLSRDLLAGLGADKGGLS